MAKSVLQVNMLGACSITHGSNRLDDQTVRSKKIWLLLEFLIVNRRRQITQDELIEVIYPDEKSADPSNALKTLLHRARSLLDALQYADGKSIILQRRGGYAWNPEVEVFVDAERFDELCQTAADPKLSRDAQQAAALAAIDLYAGDFLPKNAMEPFVAPLSTYYHARYLQTVQSALEYLQQKRDFEQIVLICKHSISIDPYNESFYYHLMLALTGLKQTKAALDQYEKMTNLFYQQFGITPSDEIKALYKEMTKSKQHVELDLGIIKEKLQEPNEQNGAFFCEYEFFKDLYRLEVRSADRTGIPVHLCLLTVNSKDTSRSLTLKTLNNIMASLKPCIQSSLRRGDIFARYSLCQYIILLPQTTIESSQLVMERISGRFYRENPRTKAILSHAQQAIDSSL